ncbi:MAG: rhodanese-like domain-containing protein [Candidatus Obscuribacterales bacterium]|nr:rhodanese-like domain-containing protein [Steroidobacteraceae bacterium]
MSSAVTAIAPAPSNLALEHFESAFRFETDCWDVHDAMSKGKADFVLFDVRGPDLFAKSHVPGAINMPHGKIIEGTMRAYPAETLFVVYCAGPHCNGAHKGAVRLAKLGRPVKLMIGGATGWVDEGFSLATGAT